MSHIVPASASVIDRDRLLDHVCGNIALLREISDIFFGDFPDQMSEMSSAIEAKNSNQVRELGHRIKGSLSNFYAPAAVAAAFQLETLGRENRLDEADEAVQILRQEVQKVADALDALC